MKLNLAIAISFSIALLSLIASTALAFTHVSPSAETLRPGQVAFQPYPGANPMQEYSFLLNSLSVGISKRIEIGTVPLMWNTTETMKSSNFNFKTRLFRSEKWIVALGIHSFFIEPQGSAKQFYDSINIGQVAFSVEHRPENSNWKYRYNLATSQMTIKGYVWATIGNTPYRMDQFLSGGVDHYFDFSYAASDTNHWILGLSQNHEWLSGLASQDPARYGVGLSHGWKIKKSLISGLSIGFHLRESSGAKALGSIIF